MQNLPLAYLAWPCPCLPLLCSSLTISTTFDTVSENPMSWCMWCPRRGLGVLTKGECPPLLQYLRVHWGEKEKMLISVHYRQMWGLSREPYTRRPSMAVVLVTRMQVTISRQRFHGRMPICVLQLLYLCVMKLWVKFHSNFDSFDI